MVDEYINILEEEDDLIQTIPVPGVQPTASGGALDIVLPPTAEGLPDQESSLEWFLRQGGEKDFTAYPKTYFGFGDTSPMYRVASEITDFIGFDVPEFLNKPVVPLGDGKKTSITQFSPTAALGALGLEFLVGENLGRTLRTMEMKEPISPFQLGELALLGFDAATLGVGGTAGAKALYKWLTQTVKKTPEDAFTLMTKNPELADDAMVGKNIDELTDEEYEKLGIGAAVAPRTSKKKKVKIERIKKETGLKTADEIPYSTVDDQLELISKKNQRADEIREIKTNRFNQMNDAKFEAALDAIENFEVNRGIKPSSDPFKNWNYASEEGLAALEKSKPKVIKQKKAPQLTPILITKADGQVPLQVYDSSGQLKKYYEIQRRLDNELSKVEYGLVDKAHTLKGRAQKAIMSHTMRGFATQDPNFIIKVLNKDRDALGRLEQARDDYTEGMMELLKQKEELVGTISKPGKIREELVRVARNLTQWQTRNILINV